MLKGIQIRKPIFHINVYNHPGWCFVVLDCMNKDSVSVDYAWISGIFVGHLDLFTKKIRFQLLWSHVFLKKKRNSSGLNSRTVSILTKFSAQLLFIKIRERAHTNERKIIYAKSIIVSIHSWQRCPERQPPMLCSPSWPY